MNDQELEQDITLDVAIIGMVCRVPGAKNTDEFWRNLCNGVESITNFSDADLQLTGMEPEIFKRPNYVNAAPILEDVELFDANFFSFSPREAEVMDPQNRIFLESAWEALENAGYNATEYKGLIGVYAGSAINRYLLHNLCQIPNLNNQHFYTSQHDFLTTNVSYKLNLKGPSLDVQTFCSTSLVSVHLACQSLLNNECDMALAGGITIRVPHKIGYWYEDGDIVSPDGHCRTFDAKAQGTIFGSGVGIVVLKRMEDAIADGDRIYAAIKGSAINNDGFLKVGFTAPSAHGQASAIANALDDAGIDADTISYIEAHGTATAMGDPVEVAALTQTFRKHTDKRNFCAIGSVKSNIGHLDAASGVTGLIKTVLALDHQKIPPTLHFEQPNPEIDFANSPFYVNTKLKDWERSHTPRRAGVSSLGFGGTNAHVVLEEAPKIQPSGASRPYQLIVLSAKTDTALESATQNLATHFKQHPEMSLADTAYTLQLGRQAFRHRRIVGCQDIEELLRSLESPSSPEILSQTTDLRNRGVNFLFTGEGSQYVKMAEGLYQQESVFCEQLDLCSKILLPLIGLDLRDILYPSASDIDEMAMRLEETAIAQPMIFAVEYAIAQLWIAWGIKPKAMIGDGLGEYVAACISGVFSLEDALRLVAVRDKSEQSFRAELQEIKLSKPKIPYISNVSGDWITAAQATDPQYWVRQLRQTIEFADGLKVLLQDAESVLLEVGASKPDLQHQHIVLTSLRDPQEQRTDLEVLLKALGQLWLAGVAIDWEAFYADERRYRVPLPTYPFERQRFWLEPSSIPAEIAQEQPVKSLASKSSNIADWIYSPAWKSTITPKLQEVLPSLYLVFTDEIGLAEKFIQKLETLQHQVITVRIGAKFTKLSDRNYRINPSQASDYESLIETLQQLNQLPSQILHLWNVTEDVASQTDAAIATAQTMGLYSLLFLTKAIAKHAMSSKLKLTVLSNNMQSVTGQESIQPEKAPLLGACKVIPQEYPHIRCQSIDIAVTDMNTWQTQKLIDSIYAEIVSPITEPVVAYRANRRWIQTYEPLKLDQATSDSTRLKKGGVYLITGGLGGIGLVLAEHLAQTCQAKLVLVGRSTFPVQSEWQQWISTHNPEDLISQKIQKLQTIESLGAEVFIAKADVADLDQMLGVVTAATQKWGEINGVIHAAGVLNEQSFQEIRLLDRSNCELQLRPKVNGLLVLEQVLRSQNLDLKLDFVILFSSLSSVLGGLGYFAYAAANLFMDAWVQQQQQITPTPWMAINWDSWQLQELSSSHKQDFGISPQQGMEVFQLILNQDALNQVVISTGDLHLRLNQWIYENKLGRLDRNQQKIPEKADPALSLHARPNLATSYVAAQNEIQQSLANIWQEFLGINQIGIYDDFFELGGDSLLITRIISRLREVFQLELSHRDLFENPTLAGLGKIIESANADTTKLIEGEL
jgi:acyl transferase domain-containing protein/acyl carrier protein